VVGATGVHRDAHYAPEGPLRAETEEALARRFVADITAGTRRPGDQGRASYHRLQPLEKKAFAAAALAHQETGVPICVHTEHGTMGLGIVEHLLGLECPPPPWYWPTSTATLTPASTPRRPPRGLAPARRPGRTKYWPDSTILQLISDLAESGLSAQLLLGGDTGRSSTMRSYGGGPGLDYLFAGSSPASNASWARSSHSSSSWTTRPGLSPSSPSGATAPWRLSRRAGASPVARSDRQAK